ncbi:MAG: hypothetical protein FWG56_06545 [Desulfovibrionaceae bacterium]|jgi:hypothetical protein|nr:hypothetical protein [Desulfovibrionaceae bacterium]
MRFRFFAISLLLSPIFCTAAGAQERSDAASQPSQPDTVSPSPQRGVASQSLSLFTGQGVDHNLPGLPKAILSGDIRWEKSY